MKTIIKLVLAGTAVAGGAVNAQTITNVPPNPNGSDIVLFVTDTTNPERFFEQDLDVQLNSLGVTQASVIADAAAGNEYSLFGTGSPGTIPNEITPGAGIMSGNVDTALVSFLSGHSTDTYIYGILAAGTGDGSVNSGQGRFLAAYTANNGNTQFQDEPSSLQAAQAAQGVGTYFSNLNLGTATGYGAPTGLGSQARGSFNLTSGINGAALGTATYLYEISTYSDASGQTDANIYAASTAITVNSNGTITGFGSASQVPLPAAVWLFGSGVLGLLGIGRRRLTGAGAVAA